VPKVGIVIAVLPLVLGAGTAAGADTAVVRRGSTFEVHATIDAGASVDLCYAVLTDFDRLAEFIPGMVSSRIVSPPGEPLRLRQTGRTRLALSEYTFDVTLAVELDAPREITFLRVAGTLQRMQGRWLVAGDAARCTIDYRAEIEPGVWVPPLIGPMLMRSQVARQVEGLESEIERRMRSAAGP
jgi:ribosome-associated toxin RatA of RatAB toxin-antitoxin module